MNKKNQITLTIVVTFQDTPNTSSLRQLVRDLKLEGGTVVKATLATQKPLAMNLDQKDEED